MLLAMPVAEVPISVLSKGPFAVPSPGKATPIPKLREVSETPLNAAPAGKTPLPAPVTVVLPFCASVDRENRDTAIASSGIAHQIVRLVIVFTPLQSLRAFVWYAGDCSAQTCGFLNQYGKASALQLSAINTFMSSLSDFCLAYFQP
jgi:hypothetical protein